MTVATVDMSQWLALRAHLEPLYLEPGQRGKLVVDVTIPDDCHIEAHEPIEPFLVPTKLDLDPVEGVAFGPVSNPEAEEKRFEWSPVVLRVYRGTIRLEVPFEVAAGAAAGLRQIRGRLSYQGCTRLACLMPSTQTVEAALEVGVAESLFGNS